MCNQSVILKLNASGETDEWGNSVAPEPSTINNCVVQAGTVYSGSNNNREIVANATVFFYADITTPLPTLTKNDVGSILVYKGVDYAIAQINENLDPFSNELWSYVLEVL